MHNHSSVLLFLGPLVLLIPTGAAGFVGLPVRPKAAAAANINKKEVNNIRRFLDQQDPSSSSFEDEAVPFSFNIEEARKQLEALVGRTGEKEPTPTPSPSSPLPPPVLELKNPATTWFHSSFPPPPPPPVVKTTDAEIILPETPPITTMDRKRRLTELELLEDLVNGNEAVSVLQEFWVNERGTAAAARLLQAENLSFQPETWPEAEEALLELIATYGVHWAEPVNRLATLYFIQGRLDESEKMCRTVLLVKPWHFGALSGIVLVYSQMQNFVQARHWEVLRLPPLSPTLGPQPRRNEWVKRSARQAKAILANAEQRLQDQFFGPRDKKKRQKETNRNLMEENNGDRADDWQ
jgi:hypothetical protein